MRFFSMILLVVGVVAAQSAPPQKGIPAIAKAANGVIVSIITSDKEGIQTGKYPEGIKHRNLSKTQVGPSAPIEFEIPLPEKEVNPPGVREKSIQVVVKFSYGTQGETHEETKEIDIANWY